MRVSALVVALAAAPAGVLAWGAAGHEVVATIAQIYLLPSAQRTVCAILNQPQDKCYLASVATWADRIRGVPAYRWASTLHYVNPLGDHPAAVCTFGEQGWVGHEGANVLGAIRNTTDWLKDGRDGADEALKFLVHFVGDMHMPLHLTGRDKGGNGVKVHFGRRTTNLHSVWDNLLVAKAIRETPRNYTRALPSRRVENALRGAIYDSYVRQIVWEGLLDAWKDELVTWTTCPRPSTVSSSFLQTTLGNGNESVPETDDLLVCPYAWASEIHPLNCEIVWPAQLDLQSAGRGGRGNSGGELLQLDEPWYAGRIRQERLLERLLATAGVRLAAVLNDLFADEDDLKNAGRFARSV